MATIVFTADSHLNKHYSRMTPDQLSRRRERLRAGVQRTVDHAIDRQADIYIHGGDLFDGPNPRSTELIWFAEQLQRLNDAGVAIILIGGNHDIPKSRLGGEAPQELFSAVRLARVFTDPAAVEWWVGDVQGVRIAVGGLPPDPRIADDADPVERVGRLAPPPADCTLLVTHYGVEGLLHPLADDATISRRTLAGLAGTIDCVLTGHLHAGSDLEIAGVPVLFPGPTERLDFGEMEVECGFLELRIEGDSTSGLTWRHVPLDPQPMRRENVAAGDIPRDRPTEWIAAHLRAWSDPEQIMQLRLGGPMDRSTYQAIRFLELWHLGNELNFYFDLDRHLLYIRDERGDAETTPDNRPSPRTEIDRVTRAMQQAADNDEERQLLEAARNLVQSRYTGEVIEES